MSSLVPSIDAEKIKLLETIFGEVRAKELVLEYMEALQSYNKAKADWAEAIKEMHMYETKSPQTFAKKLGIEGKKNFLDTFKELMAVHKARLDTWNVLYAVIYDPSTKVQYKVQELPAPVKLSRQEIDAIKKENEERGIDLGIKIAGYTTSAKMLKQNVFSVEEIAFITNVPLSALQSCMANNQ
jgi:hypothetical protein